MKKKPGVSPAGYLRVCAERDALRAELAEVLEAVRAVYYAARWTADRPVDEEKLWTDLRDACGFEPGGSPK